MVKTRALNPAFSALLTKFLVTLKKIRVNVIKALSQIVKTHKMAYFL